MIYDKPKVPAYRKKTMKDYQDLSAKKGLAMTGRFPPNAETSCHWTCLRCKAARYTYYNNLNRDSVPGCLNCDSEVRKTKTLKDYRVLAETKGLIFVGDFIPKNTATQPRKGTGFQCPKCDTWRDITYSRLVKLQSLFCTKCGTRKRGKRETPKENYYEVAESVGFTWIGEIPRTIQNPTLWQCPNGHQLKLSLNWVRRSMGKCKKCNPSRPITEDNYFKQADKLGIFWTGEKLPKNTNVATSWECATGHKWKAPYSSIRLEINQRLGACKTCRGKKTSKKSVLEFLELARHHGIKWLRPLWFDLSCGQYSTVWWSCPQKPGHIWQEQYAKLLKTPKGKACPFCTGEFPEDKRRQRTEYETLGKITGWQWIGPPGYKETRWLCPECDNKPLATFQDVEAGMVCKCGYKGEMK